MKKLARRLAAILVGLLLAIVGLEVGLRATDSVPRQRNARRAFHDHHPTLGWLGTKGYTAQFRRRGFDARISIDERGFRLPATAFAGTPDAPVVVFLGDSYTWGYGVNQGDVFTDLLQSSLGGRVRIENLGVSGFSSGQQRILLEDVALDLQPRVVVVVFSKNDLEENADEWNGRRPWYRLDGDVLVLENSPVRRKIASSLYTLVRRSLAIAAIRYELNRIASRLRDAEVVAAASGRSVLPAGELDRRWRLEEALLREMRDLCRSAEPPADLRVVYAPGLADVVGTPDGSTAIDHAGELGRLCGRIGIPYIDPSPALRAAWAASDPRGAAGEPLLFWDEHWTALGHELVAKLLAESIAWPDP